MGTAGYFCQAIAAAYFGLGTYLYNLKKGPNIYKMPKKSLHSARKSFLLAGLMACLAFLPSCSLNDKERQALVSSRDDLRNQINELRQSNETISRNITSAYAEMEELKARIAEEREKLSIQ
jgi:peptidoglycan hydrolase CwlO-like protein